VSKSERAALFVFLTLLAGLVTGVTLYFEYADRYAVPLLACCVLAALFFVVATVRLALTLRRSARTAEYGMPPGKFLQLLSPRQWYSLTVGLAIIAIGTGSLAGVQVLTADTTPDHPVAAPATTAPAPVPVTAGPTTAAPSPSDMTPSPTASPSDSPSDSPSTDPSATPTPAPHSTAYLDSVRVLDGSYNASPVTFSAARYPRGISLWCSTATNSYLQWNVAGYVKFHAVAGVDDNTQDAYGMTVEMIFYDQDGRELLPKPVESAQGHAQEITINLTGVVSLRMTCAGRQTKTNHPYSVYASLGDPVIVHG
jgi:hypothetical protein